MGYLTIGGSASFAATTSNTDNPYIGNTNVNGGGLAWAATTLLLPDIHSTGSFTELLGTGGLILGGTENGCRSLSRTLVPIVWSVSRR